VFLRRIENDRARLEVEDDGIGWTGEEEPKGTGVGSRIIRAMASSLRSSLSYDVRNVGGTRVVLEFAV